MAHQQTVVLLLMGLLSPMAWGATCKDNAGTLIPIRTAKALEHP